MTILRPLALTLVAVCFGACGVVPKHLTTTLGDSDTVITADVQDATGRIQGITFVSPVPLWAFTPDLGEFALRNDSPNVVWLTWTGGPCPTNVGITATADGARTELSFDPGNRCQSDVGKARVLALTFASPVESSTIDVVPRATAQP